MSIHFPAFARFQSIYGSRRGAEVAKGAEGMCHASIFAPSAFSAPLREPSDSACGAVGGLA
jgi:hypothetical protein